MLISSIHQPLSSLIDMNRYTSVSLANEPNNLPAGSQFKVLKYIFGHQLFTVLKKFKELESLDEQLLHKKFLRLLNIDYESLTYLSLLGLREAIIEADAFSEDILKDELKCTFKYFNKNDVREFKSVVKMGYTENHFNWNAIRNYSKNKINNPLNFWLFKNAIYSLFLNLDSH